ncbi:hypothetical protein SAMN05444680_1253 [Variovorax sp. YR216]|nr:hypothetical protein SAMN05444680_1253 [Variovorax sp. YR216]
MPSGSTARPCVTHNIFLLNCEFSILGSIFCNLNRSRAAPPPALPGAPVEPLYSRLLGVEADVVALYEQFFEEPRLGRGDVYVFQSGAAELNAFVIDMYQDRTNQVDFISLAFRCHGSTPQAVRRHLRAFFDAASVQVVYEEANCSARFRSLFDPGQYPRRMEEAGYVQQLHLRQNGWLGKPPTTAGPGHWLTSTTSRKSVSTETPSS